MLEKRLLHSEKKLEAITHLGSKKWPDESNKHKNSGQKVIKIWNLKKLAYWE